MYCGATHLKTTSAFLLPTLRPAGANFSFEISRLEIKNNREILKIKFDISR
jgi:hypothetical protein